MTITSVDNKVSYSGDAVATVFSYAFRCDVDTWMEVYIDEILQTGGYSVNRNSGGIGGNVTFVTPPGLGIPVTLIRVVPATQLIDYREYDAFPANTHEDGLDKLTMMMQQIGEISGRVVVAGVAANPLDGQYALPPYEPLKVIGWDQSLNKLVNFNNSGGGVSGDYLQLAGGTMDGEADIILDNLTDASGHLLFKTSTEYWGMAAGTEALFIGHSLNVADSIINQPNVAFYKDATCMFSNHIRLASGIDAVSGITTDWHFATKKYVDDSVSGGAAFLPVAGGTMLGTGTGIRMEDSTRIRFGNVGNANDWSIVYDEIDGALYFGSATVAMAFYDNVSASQQWINFSQLPHAEGAVQGTYQHELVKLSTLDGYLKLAGGTMTGAILMEEEQIDFQKAGRPDPYRIGVNNTDNNWVFVAGSNPALQITESGSLNISGQPTTSSSQGANANHLTRRDYVDGLAFSNSTSRTITGAWTINADWHVQDNKHLAFGTGSDFNIEYHSTGDYLQIGETNNALHTRFENGYVTHHCTVYLDAGRADSGSVNAFMRKSYIDGISDARLKENVQPLVGALGIVNKLNLVSFDWNGKAHRTGSSAGVIAQEMEKVLPKYVDHYCVEENCDIDQMDTDEIKFVDRDALLAHALKAIQELSAEVEALKSQTKTNHGHNH